MAGAYTNYIAIKGEGIRLPKKHTFVNRGGIFEGSHLYITFKNSPNLSSERASHS